MLSEMGCRDLLSFHVLLGGISPCPLGMEKKFRLFLIFQRDGNPQKTVWLVSYSITWAGPQRFGALLGTSTASSGARRRCGGLVPGWAAVSPRAASRLGASQSPGSGDCASKLPAACSVQEQGQGELSAFWATICCMPGTCLLSCLAALSNVMFPTSQKCYVGRSL